AGDGFFRRTIYSGQAELGPGGRSLAPGQGSPGDAGRPRQSTNDRTLDRESAESRSRDRTAGACGQPSWQMVVSQRRESGAAGQQEHTVSPPAADHARAAAEGAEGCVAQRPARAECEDTTAEGGGETCRWDFTTLKIASIRCTAFRSRCCRARE